MSTKTAMKNFCPAPWTEVYIGHDTTGPCCINRNLYKGINPQNYLKSEVLRNLKKEFLNGGRPESCRGCWSSEDVGIKSVRQTQTTLGKKLQRISLVITNKCNFKCRTCDPISSSAWGTDKKASKVFKKYFENTEEYDTDNFPKFADDYANIDWIIEECKSKRLLVNLLGGEPFISLGFLYFLKKVEEYNLYDNISLVITTNLSVTKYKSIDFTKELKKFKRLDIYASMDGCFKVGEYIREGFKFTKFHNNMVAMGSLITNFSTVLQVYNIYDMPTIFRYAEKMNVKVLINYMYEPCFLKVEILNKEERKKVLNYYKSINFYNKDIFKVLEQGEDCTYHRDKYKDYTDSLDKLWNKNIKDYIPELSSLSH